MSNQATVDFVEAILENRVLESDQEEELRTTLRPRYPDQRALAVQLIKRNWLTPYQTNQLFQGKGGGLVLGQYILLERLGEGGMGQVFKARHRRMNRIVALKVMRPELVANREAIKRFQREVEASGKLSHPNIVVAHDADEVGGQHFFAMEYVEGVTLSALLKQYGSPPLDVAIDYVRQLSLGLQHAHEKGMVHRDIKPGNLIVTWPDSGGSDPGLSTDPARLARMSPWGPLIKILDMGVARLEKTDGSQGSAITKEGRVVGTPDYMSPEQATNSAKADIRADVYSLGCVFYQMLTGQTPFPGGTPMEKLLKHRMDKPKPVDKLRPGLPTPIVAIVNKLMAKKPEDRYQTPGAIAQAITALGPMSNVALASPVGMATAASATPATGTGNKLLGWPFILGVVISIVLGLALLGVAVLLVKSKSKPKDKKTSQAAVVAMVRAESDKP